MRKKVTRSWMVISLLVFMGVLVSTVNVVPAAAKVKPPKAFDTVPANNIYIDKNNWWAGGDTSLAGGAPVLLTGAEEVSIPVGTTVTWTNFDGNHSVHLHNHHTGAMVGMSPDLDNGETWSFTFSAAGEYAFHCDVHKSMAHVDIAVE